MDGEEEGRGEGWRRAGKDKAGEGSGAVFRASDGASDQLGWCWAAARLGDGAASRVAQAKREVLAVLLCSSLAEERSPSPEATGTGKIKLCP